MNKTIGFIGGGNMATAIIGGILRAGLVEAEQIVASDVSKEALESLSADFGIRTTTNNCAVAVQADILVLAIKPQFFATALPQIASSIAEDEGKLVISIAAGQSLEKIATMLGEQVKLIRVMPNTPAFVGEAMSGYCGNTLVGEADYADARAILESFGQAELVPESMMDVVTGVSGSSPAYVFMFIEAMADAAVADGMPRVQAYKFAAQSVLGSAKMVLEAGKHPGELKDMVCSPGGTTIEAVTVLEQMGMRSAVIEAQRACVVKSKELSK